MNLQHALWFYMCEKVSFSSALAIVLDLRVFEQLKRVKFFINGQNVENLAVRDELYFGTRISVVCGG